MMFCTRLEASAAFSATSMDFMKSSTNCESEVWYMQLTSDISTMAK